MQKSTILDEIMQSNATLLSCRGMQSALHGMAIKNSAGMKMHSELSTYFGIHSALAPKLLRESYLA